MPLCNCGHEAMGYAIDGETLTKHVRGSIHMLLRPPAWAVQTVVLSAHKDIRFIVVIDDESSLTYTAERELFDKHGLPVNRGFGAQTALVLKYWSGVGETQEARAKKKADENAGQQMGLL